MISLSVLSDLRDMVENESVQTEYAKTVLDMFEATHIGEEFYRGEVEAAITIIRQFIAQSLDKNSQIMRTLTTIIEENKEVHHGKK